MHEEQDARIDSIGALEEFAAKYDAGGAAWYRGHGDSRWQLLPRLFREYGDRLLVDGRRRGATIDHQERRMRELFIARAPSMKLDCPPIDDRGAWSLLMQHYGIPTRLLDWTTSPLTALWFAVEDRNHAKEDGAVWVLRPDLLNLGMCGKVECLPFQHEEVKALLALECKEVDDVPFGLERTKVRILLMS